MPHELRTFPPPLDDPCGRSFTYRELMECGETWRSVAAGQTRPGGVSNEPVQDETWKWMGCLATKILDPIADRFGKPSLSYCFASRALTRWVPRGIAPSLDQHAGAEVGRAGRPICPRGGLAADVFVPGVNAADLAAWVVENLPYDRLYFYGPERPVHVSVGPQKTQQIVYMREYRAGRLAPQIIDGGRLRELAKPLPHDAGRMYSTQVLAGEPSAVEANAVGAQDVMTAAEVAAYLRITTKTVYSLEKRRELASFRIGRAVRFRRSDVERFIVGAQGTKR